MIKLFLAGEFEDPNDVFGIIYTARDIDVDKLQDAIYTARNKVIGKEDWTYEDVISQLPSEWGVRIEYPDTIRI